MPWTPSDALRYTHKATTARLRRLWARVANSTRRETGSDSRAIRAADSVVKKARKGSFRKL